MPDRKLIILLWTAIATLVAGFIIGGGLLVKHTNDIDQQNSFLNGDNDSLKRQVRQLKSTPTPTPTAPPLATPELTPAPTPSPTATPKR